MSRQQRVRALSFGEKELAKMPQLVKEQVILLQTKNGNAWFSKKGRRSIGIRVTYLPSAVLFV
jgi:hypothetical protein